MAINHRSNELYAIDLSHNRFCIWIVKKDLLRSNSKNLCIVMSAEVMVCLSCRELYVSDLKFAIIYLALSQRKKF